MRSGSGPLRADFTWPFRVFTGVADGTVCCIFVADNAAVRCSFVAVISLLFRCFPAVIALLMPAVIRPKCT